MKRKQTCKTSTVKNRLVQGVGINDAGVIEIKEDCKNQQNGKRKQNLIWFCPFYRTWKSMLKRCYSDKHQEKHPTYKGCSVVEEWLTFSNFKAWMEQQDWKGKELDKDLLQKRNKIYSPETCIFIDAVLNKFITEHKTSKGGWPTGVSLNKRTGRFLARCSNPFTKKNDHLGYFTCPNEAHQAWLKRKLEIAHELAALQTDPRVAKALIDRYNVEVYNPLHEQESV